MSEIIDWFNWLLELSLIPCVYMIIQTHLFIRAAQHVPGKVVGYKEKKDEKDRTTYTLNVEYRNPSGKKHTISSQTSSIFPFKNIGDQIIVLVSMDGVVVKLFLFSELFLPYCIWLTIVLVKVTDHFGQNLLEWLYNM